ncbi:uncharacterized protein LOC125649152 [Ostrea edulis]|uniref:uncharacterized protein LOC125649152 n=1 Tax=Ostrea edulis TaxID=37623 RepID=UPI0024AEC5EF|nr:uncharacterized protein LOC125649152 [Ostrea edulis]
MNHYDGIVEPCWERVCRVLDNGCVDVASSFPVIALTEVLASSDSGKKTLSETGIFIPPRGKRWRQEKSTKVLQLKNGSLQVFVIEMKNEIEVFSTHLHNAYWQNNQSLHPTIKAQCDGQFSVWTLQKIYTFSFLFLIFSATLNNISVIWWRTVFIGGRENPDTMYLGRDHRPSESKLRNFLTYRCERDSNPRRQR